MNKIAVDAMGGDHAPDNIVEGVCKASAELPENYKIVLVGKKNLISKSLDNFTFDKNKIEIVDASEVIDMDEHPTRAFAQKSKSSINTAFRLLKNGEISAFCGSGNTGAMLVGSLFTIKAIENVIRPPLAGYFPIKGGRHGIMLDVGANADCKPEFLNQFGELGSIYAKHTLKIDLPKVGLLNIGAEEKKGNSLSQAAYQLLKNNKRINFIGNIEGRQIFDGDADVIVTDGFTGNIVFKMGESFYEYAASQGINDSLINKMNYEVIGGSPIIGVNGNVLVGHGISSAEATKNLILLAVKQIETKVVEKIKEAFN